MLEAEIMVENCKDRANAADEERHRAAIEFQALEEGLRMRVQNAQKCLEEQAAKYEEKIDTKERKIFELTNSCKHQSGRIQELLNRACLLADKLEANKRELHEVTQNESQLIAVLKTASEKVTKMVSTARSIVNSKAEDFQTTFANFENALLSSVAEDESEIECSKRSASGNCTSINSKEVFCSIDLTNNFLEILEDLNKRQAQEIFKLTNALKVSEGALKDTKSALFRQEKLNTEISTELENYVADVKYLNDKLKKEQMLKNSIKENLAHTTARLQEEKKMLQNLKRVLSLLRKMCKEQSRC